MTKIWVLLEVIDDVQVSYPIGYYTELQTAEDYKSELEKKSRITYKIQEVGVDEEPINLDDEMEKMRQDGLVDYLIDENGEFIWELTDEGKRMMDE